MFNFASGLQVSASNYDPTLWAGTQDVSSAIQAAINTVSNAGGGIVDIPAGVWQVGRSITLASNVELCGVGNQTILEPSVTNTGSTVFLNGYLDKNDLIQDIVFNGGGNNFANGNPLVEMTTGTDIVFDEDTFENSRGVALIIQGGSANSGVTASTFTDIGNYWEVTGLSSGCVQALIFCSGTGDLDNFAENNSFSNIGLDALQLSNQQGFLAANNVFMLSNDVRAVVMSSSTYGAAIFAQNNSNSQITGNIINGAAGCGIDTAGLSNSTISWNIIDNCGSAGIGIFLGYDGTSQASGLNIFNNALLDNVNWNDSPFSGEIEVYKGDPTNIEISGNVVVDAKQDGIDQFAVELKDASVSGLTISSSNIVIGESSADLNEVNASVCGGKITYSLEKLAEMLLAFIVL